ncbi:group III truncated hemoglobin [Rhodococcus sp. D2-41]|uniref:group III truncated hemoglobin n=1 Tax=Speluncibacter jeojiensis TaxID=2710754 RepID=UPI002410B48C|nr:group III truncated hemoglobin [Rhodococcus sp. D2-41]MDG3008831.1 group III truncated hemoglobin [Rhodococcus sp. D2-41]
MTELTTTAAGEAEAESADLADRADIDRLLRHFYGRALYDDALYELMEQIRVKGLDSHLPVMCDFWETVLLRARSYRSSVHTVHGEIHAGHPFAAAHFVRWLELWTASVDALFRGPRAERAKLQAGRIAWAMHRRLTGGDSAELDGVLAGQPGTRFTEREP